MTTQIRLNKNTADMKYIVPSGGSTYLEKEAKVRKTAVSGKEAFVIDDKHRSYSGTTQVRHSTIYIPLKVGVDLETQEKLVAVINYLNSTFGTNINTHPCQLLDMVTLGSTSVRYKRRYIGKAEETPQPSLTDRIFRRQPRKPEPRSWERDHTLELTVINGDKPYTTFFDDIEAIEKELPELYSKQVRDLEKNQQKRKRITSAKPTDMLHAQKLRAESAELQEEERKLKLNIKKTDNQTGKRVDAIMSRFRENEHAGIYIFLEADHIQVGRESIKFLNPADD